MVQKSQARYIKLKEPNDVLTYVQTLINNIRRKNQEMEQLGKITYLLNTWTSAFKAHIEFTEVRKLREDIARLEEMVSDEKQRR